MRVFENAKFKTICSLVLLPLAIIYFECVFRLSTQGTLFTFATIPMLFFSVSWGCVLYFFANLFKKAKTKRIITTLLLALCAIPYLVEYFVYRFFNVFYDLNTVFAGAGDMIGEFFDVTLELIFSLDGIFKILLFFLPMILFIIFGRRVCVADYSVKKSRIVSLISVFLCFALGLLLVYVNPNCRATYKTEYNFQVAVEKYGLFTGTRLDLQNIVFGETQDFEEYVDTSAPIEEPETEQPIVYEYNKMELDLSETKGKIGELNKYVSSLEPSLKNVYTGIFKGKNLIMISAEAFTAEVIDYKRTPTLYRLATKGIQFTDFYQPSSAGTTGGEYQNIFGMLPTSGGKSFKNTQDNLNYMTIGSQLDRLGYYGQAFHNNTYTYYSRNATHKNLGFSQGFMGYGNGMEKYVKKQWPQSDLEMIAGTLPLYIDRQPFNVYYMTVSGHSGYSRSGNAMTKKNWDVVKGLPYSDDVKGYLAANQELENAVAHLVKTLEEKGIADDTVICIASDHFPYGLDKGAKLGNMPNLSELYGFEVNDNFERDHSRLILWCGSLENEEPIIVDSPTSSLDILPTLSNLFGTEYDSRLMPGRDVFSNTEPIVFNMNYDWKTEYGTYISSKGKFIPKDKSVELPKDYVKNMKTIVRNKVRYCQMALDTDYYRHLFS
ncbi:MAG: hypothetical protein E7542_06050 [Ruminococcaceae bacterium]|nr:hypothetical protein [Oscillospiraceae bacterium]